MWALLQENLVRNKRTHNSETNLSPMHPLRFGDLETTQTDGCFSRLGKCARQLFVCPKGKSPLTIPSRRHSRPLLGRTVADPEGLPVTARCFFLVLQCFLVKPP